MTPTARTVELRSIAQAIADALPTTVMEVVLTGSVSRGVADEISDIEMLVVTEEELDLGECFSLAANCGLTSLGTWGQQGGPTKRVSGYLRGRAGRADLVVAFARRGRDRRRLQRRGSGTADAIAHGAALRTSGLLARWQDRFRHYPDELANGRIEDAALKWGGFHAAGLLTLLRPGERLALLEWMVDDATRVARIVFALNRVWQPTLKRLADRVAALSAKPERMAERIEEALTEPDPRRALLVMTELQLETLSLAPAGPNVDRARKWLGDGREILLEQGPLGG